MNKSGSITKRDRAIGSSQGSSIQVSPYSKFAKWTIYGLYRG